MLNYARQLRRLDDVRTVAEGGLSPQRLAGMRDSILSRLGHPLTAAAREWHGKSLLEIARDCLEARGVRLRGVGRMELAAAALGLERGGPHGFLTTSDFPALLAQVGRTQLTAGYAAAPRTFPPWTRQGTLPDFRQTRKVSIGLGPRLLEVPEQSEYKRGMLAATLAVAQLTKYGRILAFTREAMINDDLDMFGRIPVLRERRRRHGI